MRRPLPETKDSGSIRFSKGLTDAGRCCPLYVGVIARLGGTESKYYCGKKKCVRDAFFHGYPPLNNLRVIVNYYN
jgi:hypothetical protein